MVFFNAASSKENDQLIPKHVAIIMDGNGRWAKRQHQARVFGHKAGMENVKKIALVANQLGVKVLTLFAFSTENWGRPATEVSYLMHLPIDFFNLFVPELIENNIKVEVIGEVDGLPDKTRSAVEKAVADTSQNTGMILNFAFNYGGRREIVDAAQSLARQVQEGLIQPDQINDQLFQENLLTKQLGDLANPDLIIRTSGEKRISNFLLWQAAYSEFIFSEKLWPDFSGEDFKFALASFGKRDRRFGKIKES
ncbi:isoprenyl transferase [Oenococcus kitaharae]|uniref:Isoprenyl transferase n=1 Tax=Oenococcus kitaharae DSM 17330 TaxID=1045004 RepID=G9WH63_9LACO|nr:isoprenyl transferase [Oenococcus kitaharae]EHN59552.1 Undecaprenyl pyrophosphate synthetase [Oenococcus kitaharae DSM 17330]OEY83405.1 UDP pyrophosphate synthase [Oenococcus kitaharae]OEY85204.1 UDP pyrophosphate synthase [Oenococcus kitaharae]OEY86058.1 UDP pyrophosphate synthase [Oenococcus kitaharae]